jgi:hypothetical protein
VITTVVSADESDYLAWQVALLAYSHRRVGQPGPLVVATHTTRVGDDDYTPYNKPYALARWLENGPPEQETVLVLDPDMIFVRPLRRRVERGRPLAHSSEYTVGRKLGRALRPYAKDPATLQPLAVPMLVHREDLARLAPMWFEYTKRLRADPVVRGLIPWVCEMWACSIAAAELGLRFTLEQNATVPPFSQTTELPLIHYSWSVGDFDKRTYRPWEIPPEASNAAYRVLHDLILEYRAEAD